MDRQAGSSTFWWAAAAGAIGHGMFISDIGYDPAGLAWVLAGALLVWGGLFFPIRGKWERHLSGGVFVVVLIWQIQQLYSSSPILGVTPLWYYTRTIPLLAAAGVAAMLLERFSRKIMLPIFLATFFASGIGLLRAEGEPFVDVYRVTTAACRAISRGDNPYATGFPSPFPNDLEWNKEMYPKGSVVNGRVMLGYPYMPVSLAVAYAGYVVAGDYRYGKLAALTIAAGLLAYSQRGMAAAAGACLLLTTPKVFRVLEFGWSEPVLALCMAAVIFCALRMPRLLAWMVGLLLASKQYMLLAVGCTPLLARTGIQWKSARRATIQAMVVMIVLTVPPALWDVRAFWRSAVEWHLHGPFRADSLNIAAALFHAGHAAPPAWIGVALAAAAIAAVQWMRRTPAVFAAAVAAVLLVFLAMANAAMLNYYFFVVAALCCAVSAESEGSLNP